MDELGVTGMINPDTYLYARAPGMQSLHSMRNWVIEDDRGHQDRGFDEAAAAPPFALRAKANQRRSALYCRKLFSRVTTIRPPARDLDAQRGESPSV